MQLRRQQAGSSYTYQIVLQNFLSFRTNIRERRHYDHIIIHVEYNIMVTWSSYTSSAQSGARTHWQSCQNLETSYRDVATLLFLQAPLMIECINTSQPTTEFMHAFIKSCQHC